MTLGGIDLHGVRKAYGSLKALDAVTVDIGPGLTGLLGPNGAGKTTLLRIAATVLSPDGGTVRLLGRDPSSTADRHHIRTRLGYLPQEPGFYRSFTVRDFVDYLALLKEITVQAARRAEVHRVVALVGLESQEGTKIRALSGGMRRRVALAVALLGNPDLLLLDEPTAGLDPEQQLRFRELISQLPHRPTVLLSTHQTGDVVALCDRVVVLAGGRIRFDGSPAALAATATGRVWIDDTADPRAALSWRTGDGTYRHIGDAPQGVSLATASIDDAYLLIVQSAAGTQRVTSQS